MKSQVHRTKKDPLALRRLTQAKTAEQRDAPATAARKTLEVETSWAKADWFQQWERVARREV